VAEKFKKPLFQLTCGKSHTKCYSRAWLTFDVLPFIGDLGTTARDVESALETNFALANRWGCVLLLDEADVFLAQRTKEDFKRNGLVAGLFRPILVHHLVFN
jgi:hypothetical protein